MSSALQPAVTTRPLGKVPSVSMGTVTVKGLLRNRARFALTALAVVISVAFFTSVRLLSSSLAGTAIRDIGVANKGIDVVVRGTKSGEIDQGPVTKVVRAELPTSTVTSLAANPEVAAVAGIYSVPVTISTEIGDVIDGGTFTTVAESWVSDSQLSTHHVVDGKPPALPNDVAIERRIAAKAKLKVGDKIRIATGESSFLGTITGLVDYGTVKGSPVATTVLVAPDSAAATLHAQTLDRIVVRVNPAATTDPVAALRVAPDAEVLSGARFIEEERGRVSSVLSIQTIFLTFFAVVALLAGSTIIYNTFVISVQQRTKEIAMLRAMGTSRGQILRSVLGEAALVGSAASGVGVAFGILLFRGLLAVFKALGLSFATSSPALTLSSLGLPFAVGVVVTLLSSFFPARRAASIAPMAALREQAVDSSGASRARTTVAVLLLVATIGLGAAAAVTGTSTIAFAAVGAGFLAVIVGGPLLVSGTAASLGRLLAIGGGQTGRIAQTNLSRNPRRNASTSFALSLGLALLVMFTTISGSIQGGRSSDVKEGLRADHVVTGSSPGRGQQQSVPQDTVAQLKTVPGVQVATSLDVATGIVDATPRSIVVVDPAGLAAVFDIDATGAQLASMGKDEVAVHKSSGYKIGDSVTLAFPGAPPRQARVVSVFSRALPISRDAPSYIVSPETAAAAVVESAGVFVTSDGAAATIEALRVAIRPAGTLRVLSGAEFAASSASGLDAFKNLLYALLAVALVISVVGLANTSVMSINERRREIGVLRAIGTTAKQVRRIIRLESTLLSVHGTVVGTALGVGAAAALFSGLGADEGVSLRIPWTSLVVIAVGGSVAGVLASSWPAWRGSRADPLEAIASE